MTSTKTVSVLVSLALDPDSFTREAFYQNRNHLYDGDMNLRQEISLKRELFKKKKQLLCLPTIDRCDPICTNARSTEASANQGHRLEAKGKVNLKYKTKHIHFTKTFHHGNGTPLFDQCSSDHFTGALDVHGAAR